MKKTNLLSEKAMLFLATHLIQASHHRLVLNDIESSGN
jgi:hypothetical protein